MGTRAAAPQYGLIVVSAPSGTGKSTLCGQLLREMPDRLALSISSTSRAPRGTEQHGREYFFVKREEFERKDGFAEIAEVHGNFYGTSMAMLEDFWRGQKHVLLDIDVQGAESLKQKFPDRILTVFVVPPDMKELERRLRGRGTDSEETIQKRMKNAISELARKDEFHEVIVNDDYAAAYAELKRKAIDFMDRLEAGQWPERR